MDITFCEKKEYDVIMVDSDLILEKEHINEEHIEDEKPIDVKLELTKKVKLLSLNKMNKSIFTNTFNMREYERKELQKIMHSYEDISVQEIIEEFNNMMNEKVFDNPNVDISRLPIYDI